MMFASQIKSQLKRASLLQSACTRVLPLPRCALFSADNIKPMDHRPLVTITGVSGYVGSQTCLAFLKDGTFRVRGTIRGRNSRSKINNLRETFGNEYFSQLEIVEANLQNEVSLMYAIEDSEYVVHTAFPFLSREVQDENELIGPAVKATMTVMRASLASHVKRVVLTSSMAAIMNCKNIDKQHYTSEDWAEESECDPMQLSKKLSEKAAWKFIDELPQD